MPLVDRRRVLVVVATLALVIAGLFAAGARAQPPPSSEVSFGVSSLFPKYSPHIHDYVVRCNDAPVTVRVHASGGWRVAIGNQRFRRGDFRETVPLSAGRAFRIAAKYRTRAHRYRFHVRCLPNDFPTYTFTRHGRASPELFSVDEGGYAIVFDNHGVPIWWYQGDAHGTRVRPNGNVLWADESSRAWQIHRLDGSLVRSLSSVGQGLDLHDLQFVGNGDYLVGAAVVQSHVDTSAYGGSSDADVLNAEFQEVGPDQTLVWDWKSQDHISLAETGRWWDYAIANPILGAYDIVHWNSIDSAGGSVIASFRHLDGVYKIRKSTGNIVWKLGGTTTPQSLEVKNDPRSHPLGGQHDARLLPDGTLTLFNDRTDLGNDKPRAERYRINQKAGTATLLQSITDPEVSSTFCCGSARRLPNRDWLIDWGGIQNNPVGGYKPDGQRTFLLRFDSGFSYRAEPVPGTISARDLRQGMRAM